MSTLEQRVQAALDRGIGPDTKDVIRDQMREIERLRAALVEAENFIANVIPNTGWEVRQKIKSTLEQSNGGESVCREKP